MLQAWLTPTPRDTGFMPLDQLGWAVGTSFGHKRTRNEDRACIARLQVSGRPTGIYLAIVCDGLGGMHGGEESAVTAASAVIAHTYQRLLQGKREPLEAVLDAIRVANDDIYNKFRGQGGTTISVLLLIPGREAVGINVGDSRIYELRNGEKLIQLTSDDNIAAEVGNLKALDPAGLQQLEFGEHLTQFVGIGPDIRIHPIRIQAKGDSSFLLASDGAWRYINGVFNKVVVAAPNANEVVRRTILVANWAGGFDNTTVIALSGKESLAAVDEEFKSRGPMSNRIDLWSSYDHWSIFLDAAAKVPTSPSASGKGRARPQVARVVGPKKKEQGRSLQKDLITEPKADDQERLVNRAPADKPVDKQKQLNIEIVIEDHAQISPENSNP